jgi:flavin reductase (DIM6/NTAB) family NADH-FMN oxidoreductase RutF
MIVIDSKNTETKVLHQYLLGSIGPRPIAFASTMDRNGNPNLSPFSFFNVFSANPPVVIFSPARRVRDNSTKDTLANVIETKEVCINVVTYGLVEQASLASTEYPRYVNEFTKAGLTPLASDLIRPFRVKESPVQMECRVMEVISLGDQGGAGNLVMAEVLRIHINPEVLDENGMIDQTKIDLVGRMGGDWYVRAHGEALFEVEKPNRNLGIGVDMLPPSIRSSYILSGNDLGKLANVSAIPGDNKVQERSQWPDIQDMVMRANDGAELRELLHEKAKELLASNKVEEAWTVLLIDRLNRTL